MYCPNCGSQNQEELKFCTRCGTNLGIVSDALTGKFDNLIQRDERIVQLLTNYYRGRRSAIIGFIVSAISVFKMTLILLLGNPEKLAFFFVLFLSLLFLSLLWLVWGAVKWVNAGSELQALGYDKRQGDLPGRSPQQALPDVPATISMKGYTTDSMNEGVSITEHTTRQLAPQSQSEPQKDSA